MTGTGAENFSSGTRNCQELSRILPSWPPQLVSMSQDDLAALNELCELIENRYSALQPLLDIAVLPLLLGVLDCCSLLKKFLKYK